AQGSASMLAGNFAVKEAVAKAFGTGFRTFMPIDIETLRDELGKPYVVLHGEAKTQAGKMGIGQIHTSISNTKEYAFGFAIAEGDS
ncbi:MAG: holo-ACP synthase, partial [Hungatella sp.]